MVQAFVVCREITQSPGNGEHSLIAPFCRVTGPAFPADIPMAIYAFMTCACGRYEVRLELTDDDGCTVCSLEACSFEEWDPLMPHRIALHRVFIRFPHPGRFDLVMLANGEPLAHHVLWARLPPSSDQ
jgi:hypothetical protein